MATTLEPARLFLDVRAELGEGPVWDTVTGCMFFVDILQRRVHRVDTAAHTSRAFECHTMVGALAPAAKGEWVAAVEGGFARFDPSSGSLRPVLTFEGDCAGIRMNDGKCDPAGRFWAGTMALDERPCAGTLYRLDPGGAMHAMLRAVTISNGLDWTADNRRMYFIDSPTRAIDTFDFDLASGAIENRRTLVRVPREDGVPDGMTLDAEGNLWVALWGGAAVHCYAPDGTRLAVLPVPVTYPTSCAFGGPDLRDLYITSAAVKLSTRERETEPGGALFVSRPGVAGRAPQRFAG